MASPFVGGRFIALSAAGAPLPGAKVYTYAAGTLTPLATFTDAGGLSSNANPVVCDSAGLAYIGLSTSTYKLRTYTTDDVFVREDDNISNPVLTGELGGTGVSQGDALVIVKSTLTGGVSRTQHAKNADIVSTKDIGAVADGTTLDQTAVAAAITAMAAAGGVLGAPGPSLLSYARKMQPGDLHINHHDYATIGTDEQVTNSTFATSATGWTLANFTASGSPDKITHAASTVGTASRSLTLDPYCLYKVSIKIVTTTAGVVDFSLAGNKVYAGVYTDAGGTPIDGVWLDSGAVDVDGSGVNGVAGASGWPNQSADTWTFLYLHQSATQTVGSVVVTTDTRWAGNIQTLSVIKIATETQFAGQALTQAEAAAGTYRSPVGWKATNNGSECLFFGDRRTGAMVPVTPATPPYSGALNTVVGVGAAASMVNGVENCYFGNYAAQHIEGSANLFGGYSAGRFGTKVMECVGLGYKTQYVAVNTVGNTSVGCYTLNYNRIGNYVTAVGELAGRLGTDLSRGTLVGAFAGVSLEGTDCALVGYRCGPWTADIGSATSAYNFQSGLGSQAYLFGTGAIGIGYNARVGANGAAVSTSMAAGYGAIVLADNGVALGVDAQITASGATVAVAIGSGSRANGAAGVSIGSTAGTNVTGADNTAVGNNAGKTGSAQTYTNCTSLGANATPTGSNQVTLGNGSVATLRCQQTSITALSDARDKRAIEDIPLGLEFINTIRPVRFKWEMRDGTDRGDAFEGGFIAQELKAAQQGNEWLGLVHEADPDRIEATPGRLLPVLIKALQEMRALNVALTERVAALEGRHD